MLLVALAAHADPIVSVGDPHTYSLGGGWARAYPAEDGWHFLWSAGGDYNLLPMNDAYEIDDRDRKKLTGYTTLADHGITRCPDGSFLHGASANLEEYNDSAYAFRFDENFDLIGGGAVEERNPERQHNDLAVSCGDIFSGVGFNESGMNGDAIIFPIDDDGDVGADRPLKDAPFMQGASFAHDDDGTLILLSVKNHRYLHLVRYDEDLEPIDIQELDPLDGSMRVYWPQGLMRVGDHWIVAHMARDENLRWNADEGDVWLAVYTADWELVQNQQVTEFDAPAGGMRPGLARKNETLLVSWDSNVSPGITPVELDLTEFGVEEGQDTGQWTDPQGDGDEEEEEGGPSFEPWEGEEEGCGCSTAPVWSLGGLLFVPWWRRRC